MTFFTSYWPVDNLVAYINWDGRPALIADGRAWAMLEGDDDWREIDCFEVSDFGHVRSEIAFKQMFGRLPPLPSAFVECLGARFTYSVWDDEMLDVCHFDWQGRPAIVTGTRAWSVLPNRGPFWHEVDVSEVWAHGLLEPKERFERLFAPLPALPPEVEMLVKFLPETEPKYGDGRFDIRYLDWKGRPAIVADLTHAWIKGEPASDWKRIDPDEIDYAECRFMCRSEFDTAFKSVRPLPPIADRLERVLLPPYDGLLGHFPRLVFYAICDGSPAIFVENSAWTVEDAQECWIEVDRKTYFARACLRSKETIEKIFDLPPLPSALQDLIDGETVWDPLMADLASKVYYVYWGERGLGKPTIIAGIRAWTIWRKGEDWCELEDIEVWSSGSFRTEKNFERNFPDLPPYPKEVQKALAYLPIGEDRVDS